MPVSVLVSITAGLGRQPVLISKKSSGLGLDNRTGHDIYFLFELGVGVTYTSVFCLNQLLSCLICCLVWSNGVCLLNLKLNVNTDECWTRIVSNAVQDLTAQMAEW